MDKTPDSTYKMDSAPKAELQHINPDSVKVTPLTKEAILNTYKDVFEGLGTFPGEPVKFHLKPDAKPA